VRRQGWAVHLMLSLLFAALFAAVATAIASITPESLTKPKLVLTGVAFGIGVMIVKFQILAPAADWMWFTERTIAFVDVLAHTLFFGGPLGWMLGRAGAESWLTT
jgi:hypothetical protein